MLEVFKLGLVGVSTSGSRLVNFTLQRKKDPEFTVTLSDADAQRLVDELSDRIKVAQFPN